MARDPMHMDVRRHLEGSLTRAIVAAALVAGWLVLAAPARAVHLEWKTDEGVPQTAGLEFEDVASVSASGAVVAVGLDAEGAAIRRRPGTTSVWVTDTVTDTGDVVPEGATNLQLTSVALTADTGWAVGSYKEGTEGTIEKPLVVRLAGSPTAGEAQAWNAVTIPEGSDMVKPTSVALRSGPPPVVGLIGDDSGKVFKIEGAGIQPGPGTGATPAADAVTGIALFGTTGGLAAGTHPGDDPTNLDNDKLRIYTAATTDPPAMTGLSPTQTQPDLGNRSFAGIAATSSARAVAIEQKEEAVTPAYWEPDSLGVWTRQSSRFESSTTLGDVAVFNLSSSSTLVAIAGAEGGAEDGKVEGTVWLRRAGTWTEDRFAGAPPLNGVAIVSSQEVIAAGEKGLVKRLSPGDHPPVPAGDPAPEEDGQETAGVTEPQAIDEPDPPAKKGRPCTTPKLRGQNVRDIEVQDRRRTGKRAGTARVKGRLVIRFRLRRAARVQILALRRGKVVGRTKRQVLRRGRHTLRLPYREPPQKVRIKAQLVRNCDKRRRRGVAYVPRDTRTNSNRDRPGTDSS